MFNINGIIIDKKIISDSECEILNDWAIKNYRSPIFQTGKVAGNRRTTRFTKNIEYNYPSIVDDIIIRLKEKYGLTEFEMIEQGNKGVICAISGIGSKLVAHTDPNYSDSESLHFIIQSSKAKVGGNLIIKGIKYEVNEGDCLSFFASSLEHCTDTVGGDKKRIVWIFGFKVPKKHIE